MAFPDHVKLLFPADFPLLRARILHRKFFNHAGKPAALLDLYLHPRTMYLTFDDGPSEENTNAVLDILKERNIKATFFLVGENVEKHPEVARRIAAEGHTIGPSSPWQYPHRPLC